MELVLLLFTVSSTGDYDGDGSDDGPCWSDNSTYFYFYWEGGCLATNINYSGGDLDLTSYGFTEGFFFYGFEDNTSETFTMSFSDGTSATASATTGTCDQEGCGDGYVPDCVDDDCCLESWIGDGYGDCEDQAYGCDLTCYDNDGGDCGGQREDVTYAPIERMYMYAPEKQGVFSNVSLFDLVTRHQLVELENSNSRNDGQKYHHYLTKEFYAHMLESSLALQTEVVDKEYYHDNYSIRDLQGYNVLRDGSENCNIQRQRLMMIQM